MRTLTVTAFFVLVSFIELVLVPFPLTFIALFLWQQLYNNEEALVFAFLTGFIFDILLIRPLGITAICFMVILFITMLYKRKYHDRNAFFLGVIVFLSMLALDYMYAKNTHIFTSIFGALLTVILAKVFAPIDTNKKPVLSRSRIKYT